MNDESKKYHGPTHEGDERSAPYPVSRLAPAIELVNLAKEIADADKMLNVRVSSKLKVIADQIRALQSEAKAVLDEAKRDQDLNHAQCNFQRKPGMVYHLYQKPDKSQYFSMLSPEDWRGQAPHEFVGSYRLENDMSWSLIGKSKESDNTRALIEHLLAASDIATE